MVYPILMRLPLTTLKTYFIMSFCWKKFVSVNRERMLSVLSGEVSLIVSGVLMEN